MIETVQPTTIRLEAASHCQLRCPTCPTTSGAISPAIGSGFLRATDFRELLERNPQVREIELSNYGEIFLNPELSEILRIAHERGVGLLAQNGVNLNVVHKGVLEDLVRYRLHSMTCSIDGATPETYEQYRVRGSLTAVLDNIRAINALKRHHRSPFPLLRWQFVVFGHNEHEIPAARRLAADLKMDFAPKLNWDAKFSPVRDRDFVLRETGLEAASRSEYRQHMGEEYAQGICLQLWTNPQINWDGKVLGCCRNFWGDFGANAFRDGLQNAINSDRMRHARAMLAGEAPARDDIPCTTCEIYHGRKADGRWVRGGGGRRILDSGQALAYAAKFLTHGRLIDAEPLFLKVLTVNPSQPEALLGMATLRHGLGWEEAARAFAQAAVAVLPGDPRPRGLLDIIECELGAEPLQSALETTAP